MSDLNRLNNIVNTQKAKDDIKTYLFSGKFPDEINSGKKKTRFERRCADFVLDGEKLIYNPSGQIVVNDNDKEKTLKDLYFNLEYAGMGPEKMYHKVAEKFLGFDHEDIKTFLRDQEPYQLTKEFKHHINKPIIVDHPNERWSIDLIDMNAFIDSNRGFRYILSCCDYFSRFCWARPVKNKTSTDITKAFKTIITEAGIKPHQLQTDNGGEFLGDLDRYLERENITHIKALSYSPQSQGLIESKNKIIRKILREIMVRHNNHEWVNYLNDAIDNINNRRNKTVKYNPSDLWVPSYVINDNDVKQAETADRLYDRAARILEKEDDGKIKIGDVVRVKETQIRSDVRRKIKDGDKKNILVTYSPDLFVVRSVIAPDRETNVENLRYTLNYLADGKPFLTELKLNNPNRQRDYKRVFGSDLIKVNVPNMTLTQADAEHLNQINVRNPEKRTINRQQIVQPINAPVMPIVPVAPVAPVAPYIAPPVPPAAPVARMQPPRRERPIEPVIPRPPSTRARRPLINVADLRRRHLI